MYAAETEAPRPTSGGLFRARKRVDPPLALTARGLQPSRRPEAPVPRPGYQAIRVNLMKLSLCMVVAVAFETFCAQSMLKVPAVDEVMTRPVPMST